MISLELRILFKDVEVKGNIFCYIKAKNIHLTFQRKYSVSSLQYFQRFTNTQFSTIAIQNSSTINQNRNSTKIPHSSTQEEYSIYKL